MVGTSAVGAFAARLRALREARSLTQEELSERSGLSVKAIGALERGERRRPHPHTVRALADALLLGDAERAALVAAVPSRGGPAAAAGAFAGSGLAPIFGRDEDLTRVADLLTVHGARFLTLTGPGGVGKTRLATEVAARVRDAFPGGVRLLDLAAVREPDEVLPQVAAALGVVEEPTGTVHLVERVAGHLAGRRVLLVLDNLEQVVACGPRLADLLGHAPGLTVLATSRAPLRVRAEQVVPVVPLALPGLDDGAADLTALAASPAVAMFLDRASAVGGQVPDGAAGAATLAAITRRLDGLPLAIELAAAAARVLPPDALLARLEAGTTDVGVAGPRDLPVRQRSMTAVLDGSVGLLEPEQRDLFLRAAVFSGGFSLDWLTAVEALVEPPPTVHADDVVPRVAALVDQALVLPAPSPDGVPRFRLLEPVRQYAITEAHAAGLALPAADAHAVHARQVAVDAHRRLWSAGIGPVLDRVEAERGNLRSGLLRLLELGRVPEAADLAGGLWPYFAMRGRVREGLEWLERVEGTGTPMSVARVAVGRMGLMLVVGEVGALRMLGDVAIRLSERAGDALLLVEAVLLSGLGAIFAGDLSAGERLLALAEARAEDVGTQEPREGDARLWARLQVQLGRGQALLLAGDAEVATRQLEEAVVAARALGNEFGLATSLNTLATARQVAGDDATAAALLGESLAVSFPLRLGWTLGYAVPELAGVAGRSGRPTSAAYLFGAAATLGDTTAVDPHYPPSRLGAESGLAVARTQLESDAFTAAWDAGRTATQEEVARFAAGVVADIASPGSADLSLRGRG
ncbi:helix-turn-helix domain-containing protein [Terracoccus sp. 273MFTsu3.1]|uniref:ATP-binding protein n=1 Tax=Terracoccus sp. 273MFTsu3.1 TaxID=1172188 RepID=UPI00039BFA82|nr:helix-turn-helix domain-containing protein [Terracoccus sp. 273MFTsu3.1]